MNASSGTFRMRVDAVAPSTVDVPTPSRELSGEYGRPPRGRPAWIGLAYLAGAVVVLLLVRAGYL